MPDVIEFVRLRDAAAETPWCARHLYRVLTDPNYTHLDPRPPIRRFGGRGYNVLLRSDWEIFKQRLVDDGQNAPKRSTNLSRANHQARLDREAAAAS